MSTIDTPSTLFCPDEGWDQEEETSAAGVASLPSGLDLSPPFDSDSLSDDWHSVSTLLDFANDNAPADDDQMPNIPDSVSRLCDLWNRSALRTVCFTFLDSTLRPPPRLSLTELAARAKEAWLAVPLPQLADEPYQTAENANTFYAYLLSDAIESDHSALVDYLLGLRFPTYAAAIQRPGRPASLKAILDNAPSLFDSSPEKRNTARSRIRKRIWTLKTHNLTQETGLCHVGLQAIHDELYRLNETIKVGYEADQLEIHAKRLQSEQAVALERR